MRGYTEMRSSPYKVYVSVVARFTTDGKILPISFEWEDGRCYEVDKVLDIRRAASVKAGGHGMRYTVHVSGENYSKETCMWLEEGRWFMERK